MKVFVLIFFILFCGCRTASSAVKRDDVNTIARDVRKDPATKSAVEAITRAVSGGLSDVRYCPVDGQRFSGKIKICPVHHVELKSIEE